MYINVNQSCRAISFYLSLSLSLPLSFSICHLNKFVVAVSYQPIKHTRHSLKLTATQRTESVL